MPAATSVHTDLPALLAPPPQQFEEQYSAMLPSSVLDANGTDHLLRKGGGEGWTESWVAARVLNVAPEIAGGYSEWPRTALVHGAFAAATEVGAVLDGITLDHSMSAPAVDPDPLHLPLADRPLTYDPASYRPAIHTMVSPHEHLVALRAHIDQGHGGGAAFRINAKGIGTLAFLEPLIDVFGGAGDREAPIRECACWTTGAQSPAGTRCCSRTKPGA